MTNLLYADADFASDAIDYRTTLGNIVLLTKSLMSQNKM